MKPQFEENSSNNQNLEGTQEDEEIDISKRLITTIRITTKKQKIADDD